MNQKNGNIDVHPEMIRRKIVKTQAKIGAMLMDLVRRSPKMEQMSVTGIVGIQKHYHIGDRTFHKYLGKSIYQDPERKTNKKILHLSKLDMILVKEIIFLEERYQHFDTAQRNIIRCLIAKLGKTL